jgi:hypothetical protein
MFKFLNKIMNNSKEEKILTSEDLFKETKEEDIKQPNCKSCEVKDICKLAHTGSESYLCGFVKRLPNYHPDKPSILIFDDNPGVVSFLEDDINDLHDEGIINKDNYNIIIFTSQYAAFNLLATIKSYDGMNIKYGIFDITIGGGVYEEERGNVVLDGVDAFIECRKHNKDMNYIFFTGNKLNPYINKNKEIINKYHDYTDEDIDKHILYKTSLSPEDRKEYIKNFLTQPYQSTRD